MSLTFPTQCGKRSLFVYFIFLNRSCHFLWKKTLCKYVPVFSNYEKSNFLFETLLNLYELILQDILQVARCSGFTCISEWKSSGCMLTCKKSTVQFRCWLQFGGMVGASQHKWRLDRQNLRNKQSSPDVRSTALRLQSLDNSRPYSSHISKPQMRFHRCHNPCWWPELDRRFCRTPLEWVVLCHQTWCQIPSQE